MIKLFLFDLEMNLIRLTIWLAFAMRKGFDLNVEQLMYTKA